MQHAPRHFEAVLDEDAAELADDWEEDAEGDDDGDDVMQELDHEPEEATSSRAASDDAGPGVLNGRLGPNQVCLNLYKVCFHRRDNLLTLITYLYACRARHSQAARRMLAG